MAQGFGGLVRDIAIDLGTANTLVYARGRGIVVDEPSVVAVQRAGTSYGRVLAVGEEARLMLGRTPDNIVAMRPLKDGVIADFQVAEQMLRYFIEAAVGRQMMLRPRIVVCIPSGVTDVEKRAVYESARAAGGKEVHLIPEPLAAALGAGLPVMEPTGSMIVDIGGGTTEVAVISLGGIVQSQSLRVAGDRMDTAIVAHVRQHYELLIGERSAENIKLEIGTARSPDPPMSTTVKGRDANTGVPRQVTLTSVDVQEALKRPIARILASMRSVLEATPPELAADVARRGITICGGGALLPQLADVLADACGVAVHVADEPLRCVARGAGVALEDPVILHRVVLD